MKVMADIQDVHNCLDGILAAKRRQPRIDTNGPILLREIVLQFEKRAKKEVKRQLQHVPAEKRRAVYAFFCEDQSYGAFAVRDRYDYIILHIGIVPRIVDFFDRMMKDTELWTSVTENAPNDPVRVAFAVVFMNECFDIIVRHELAHLVLGHCEFRSSCSDALALQALEVAADGHSVNWGVQKLEHFPKLLGKRDNAVDEAYRMFQRTTDDAMRNYLLAVYFVFRLMDETAWLNGTLTTREHPPAPIRFHVACLHLHEYFEQRGDVDGQTRLAGALDGLWELGEHIFATSLGKIPDLNAKRQVMEVESEQHFARVHECAKALPQSLFGLCEQA
ncbi:MAG: hypothetical protein ACLP19_04970 [Xanthobacteraceae bacterium]